VTGEALWPYALEIYGRPAAEPLLLELQDAHGQCVPYLLWALWLAASGRSGDLATMGAGAALAQAWQEVAIQPLRERRRGLKARSSGAALKRLNDGVKKLELEAERMLLQMLEDASPGPAGDSRPLAAALTEAATIWGDDPPAPMLAELAAIAER
jgi:uncharacterized protein (TIGR02444 family)